MKGLGDWVRSLSTRDLPVLRSSVDALDRMRKDEDGVTARDLADVILRDPLLAARVLRYSQARLTSRQPTEVTTVEHAIMMHGVTPFFRQFQNLQTLEDALGAHPRALRGALGVISRAYHAATNARHFAALRHDLEGDEVMLSALLHDLSELLLWWVAPEAAMQIERMLASVRELRSQAAQRVVLGFTLDELQLELAREWRLPKLLQALMDVRQASTYRVRTVQLSLAVARHSAHGWYDPALANDYDRLRSLLSLPVEQVVRRVRHCALQAARCWQLFGVPPAAAWLPMLPGDWPVDHARAQPGVDAPTLARTLDQFAFAQQHSADRSSVEALLMYGLEVGLGMSRVWIGRLDRDAGQVRKQHATRADAAADPIDLSFAVGEGGLFDRLIERTQAVWWAPARNSSALDLVPPQLRPRLGAGGFCCMSIELRGADTLLAYADMTDGQLDDARYNAFKHLCGAARAALLTAAAQARPPAAG
jgi:HD-like signal output (HDOD) protein